jgi:hypothetical protein
VAIAGRRIARGMLAAKERHVIVPRCWCEKRNRFDHDRPLASIEASQPRLVTELCSETVVGLATH